MLLIDILAVFPFNLVTQSGAGSRSNVFIRFLRMARLTRMFRASKILKILRFMTTSDSMQRLTNLIRTYNGITRLAGAMFIVIILAHFTACMWYFIAKID